MLPKGLLKEYAKGLALLIKLLDMLCVLIAGITAYLFKFNTLKVSFNYLSAILIGVLLLPFIFSFFSLYKPMRDKKILIYLTGLVQGIGFFALCLAGLAFLSKAGEFFSRIWFLVWMVGSGIAIIFFRCVLLFVLRYMRHLGMNERRVMIIGSSELTYKLVENIQRSLWTGFRLIHILENDIQQKPDTIHGVPVIKKPGFLGDYFAEKKVDEVWIAVPFSVASQVKSILHELRHHTITIRFILDTYGLDLFQHEVTDLAGIPAINICSSPMVGMNRLIKALEDRLLAAIIILGISPLLLLIAVAIKITSPGPIFYRQKRIGWNGKEFEMLKFRTMPVNAEKETGPVWATQEDVRPTRLGKVLRRISFDELPQFINVLKGDMSIVGPRPERKVFVNEFSDSIPRYMQKHLVKAGITGWAQVNGWRGNTSLEKRIEYDLFYIENWSLAFDLKIIFLTLLRGFIHRNAY